MLSGLSMTIKLDVSSKLLKVDTDAVDHPIGEVLKSSKVRPNGKENQTQKKLNVAS